jgi:hypothetical protein
LFGCTIVDVPFATDPVDATNDVGQPFYPYASPYGGASGFGSGWITPSAFPGVAIEGGGYGLVANIKEMGTFGHYVILQPFETVRATFRVNAVTGFASLFNSGFGPDLPWRASYTSLLDFGYTQMTLI